MPVAYFCDRNVSVIPDTEYLGDISRDGYLENRTGTSSHGRVCASISGTRRTHLQLRPDRIMVLSRDKKEKAGVRVAQGHSQQISFTDPGPPVVVEDYSRRPFVIMHPRGKGLRFADLDRRGGGQRRRRRADIRLVRGLSGVGPFPTVSRALGLSSAGR